MQSMSRDSTGSTPTTGTTDYWLPIKWEDSVYYQRMHTIQNTQN